MKRREVVMAPEVTHLGDLLKEAPPERSTLLRTRAIGMNTEVSLVRGCAVRKRNGDGEGECV